MGCSGRIREEELRPEQKWDFISLNDFKSTSCWFPFTYGYLWISLIISIAVYAVDTFTAVNLLAFDKWSGEIQPAIPVYISKWVFSACIIASWVNLGFEYIRAIRVMKRGAVAESFMDSLAVRLQCIRLGKQGRGWRRFLVFTELASSRKGSEYVALFTYFSFQAWIRIIFCQGPRQVINALTLYSVFRARLSPADSNDVGSAMMKFFKNIELLAEQQKQQAVILSGMMFTLVVWVFAALSLLLAVFFYIFFLWHYIPNSYGGLTGYCGHKVDKRLSKLVSEKVDKAILDEERRRVRADAKALKKGEKPPFGRQATLPTLFDAKSEDKLPDMPMLNRNDTVTTLPLYSSRPGTPSSQQPALPNIELDRLDQKRPLPGRSITGSSGTSFSSNAPLIGNASDMAYGRAGSPVPSLPSLDMTNLPPQPSRTLTSNSSNSQWSQGPAGGPRMPSAIGDRGYTQSPMSYADGRNTPGAASRNGSINTFGRPYPPRGASDGRSDTMSSGPPPSIAQRTPYNPGSPGERASPAPGSNYGQNSPRGGPMSPSNGGYQSYNPNIRSASAAPSSFPLNSPRPQQRNMTDPTNRVAPSGGDYFSNGNGPLPDRPGTGQSGRVQMPGLPSPARYNNGGSPGFPQSGMNSPNYRR